MISSTPVMNCWSIHCEEHSCQKKTPKLTVLQRIGVLHHAIDHRITRKHTQNTKNVFLARFEPASDASRSSRLTNWPKLNASSCLRRILATDRQEIVPISQHLTLLCRTECSTKFSVHFLLKWKVVHLVFVLPKSGWKKCGARETTNQFETA